MSTFVAIDFETADYQADSACAVALVRVEGWEVVAKTARLIRPPRQWMHSRTFTASSGSMSRTNRRSAKCGGFRDMLDGADRLVAHNAPFDRNVLRTCFARSGSGHAGLEFLCTVQLARRTWNLRPANLPAVCRSLDIPLNHHDALSDAEAAARIVIAARRAFASDVRRPCI